MKRGKGEWENGGRKDAGRKTQDAGKKEWEKGRMGEWENGRMGEFCVAGG